MPFTSSGVGGDRYNIRHNMIPKKPLGSYTPVAGDLLIIDTTGGNLVTGVIANSLPYGMVESINNNNGVLTVAKFVSGTVIELPYTGAPTLGQNIQSNGVASARDTVLGRTIVKGVASPTGVGTIVAKDADCPHGVGFITVEF